MPKPFDVQFNADARRTYLTSFSSKKKQRRAFGLAMQKVKDRRDKLEQRKEHRKRVAEEADEFNGLNDQEDETNSWMEDTKIVGNNKKSEGLKNSTPSSTTHDFDQTHTAKTLTTKFVDPLTHAQFGGEVIVTTTFDLPDDEGDVLPVEPVGGPKHHGTGVDVEQRFSGSVKKFLNDKLPAKKRRMSNSGGGTCRKKGRHGAEGMKGMGSAKDLKLAQKTLNQVRGKVNNHHTHGKHSDGKKNKRNKGGRK